MNHLIIRFLSLLAAFPAVPLLHAEDFNRPNVAYTNDGGKIGWYWQASGAGHWSIKDHQLYVDNSDPSLQEDDQTLYHTRVSLQPGDWSASIDVRNETTNGYVGMAFMVQPGGTSFYQIRLRSGSRQVQVLKNSPSGTAVIDSDDESSAEIFDPGQFYSINAGSTTAGQFEWSISNISGSQVASGSFTDASYASGYAGVVKNAGDGNVDIARFDNFYVREITVPPITQPHPRLLVTAADISEIQADIAARVEPRYSTWLQLRNRANAWSLDPPSVTAPYTGEDATQFFLAARGAGHRSSKMALAYLLDGNPDHAAKAKEILLEWARATPRPGTHFPPVNSTNYVGAGMNVARGISGLVFTYDYLYNELSPTERADVESWFRDMLPVVRTAIETWDTPHQLSPTDPRGYVESSNLDNIYFYGQLYQNHSVSHTMAHLVIGYALGDRELVQFALDSKENPRSYLNLFEGNILMAGESPPDVYTVGNPPAQDGEIYDRYRQVQGTGLGYAALSLHQMMAMSEVLYMNGIDVYSRTGAHGETLRKPFEFYADFYRLGDSSIKGGFYTGEPVTAGSYPAAVFEVANKRYPGTPEITLLLNSIDRVAADPGGFPETYFCYPTLTHGVSLPSWTGALGSDFETAGNWNTAIPVDDAVSQVAFFDGTPPNMPQLTRHRSLAGMHLRGGNTTLSASAGQVLTLGALGIRTGAAGSATQTISAPLHLAAAQTWDVPASKTLLVSGNITGTTGLTKSGNGTLTLAGSNNYTGETIIRAGVAILSNARGLGASGSGNATVVSPGARVEVSSAGTGTAEDFTIHSSPGTLGALRLLNSNIILTGRITLADHSRITGRFNQMQGTIDLGAYTLTVSKNAGDVESWNAVISGTGGLTMAGGNATTKLTLAGPNTYTGDTTVTSGILAVNGSSIADSNKLIINGGKVEATGTEVVGSLVFGTIQQIPGSYGSSASSATYKDDTRFAGSGVIHVAPYSVQHLVTNGGFESGGVIFGASPFGWNSTIASAGTGQFLPGGGPQPPLSGSVAYMETGTQMFQTFLGVKLLPDATYLIAFDSYISMGYVNETTPYAYLFADVSYGRGGGATSSFGGYIKATDLTAGTTSFFAPLTTTAKSYGYSFSTKSIAEGFEGTNINQEALDVAIYMQPSTGFGVNATQCYIDNVSVVVAVRSEDTDPPVLSVNRFGNNVVLSWPAHVAGWTLESSLDLGINDAWHSFPGVAANSVTVPLSGNQQFFRLKKTDP